MLKKILPAVAVSCVLATSAYATPNGFYAGGQLGYSDSDYTAASQGLKSVSLNGTSTQVSGPANTKTEKDHLGGRLYTGYQFNKYLGAELGFTDYGDNKIKNAYGLEGTNVTLNNQAVDLVGKLSYPVTDKFDVFGKAGGAYVMADKAKSDVTATTVPGGAMFSGTVKTKSMDKLRPTYGLGASYMLTNNVSADLSYMRIQGGNGVKDTSLTALGVAYHFA
ncbi:MAG: hypothetical protein CMF50_03180 [Legionellales bacterium]|nr:hypothetical protein [Legionellales bacterium]|tara:strand:+ start:24240 stop:24902 length:663 start_codon:yes stop_codon:yes gene_type:complete